MLKFLGTPSAQAVLWTTVLLVLMVVAYYVVKRFRDFTGEDTLDPNELLSNFREMRQEGDISEKEFRTIRTVLGAKLQDELKDSDNEG